MPSTWFIVKPDRQLGPYTSAQMKQLAASGQLKADDLVRKADQTTTVAAGKIRGLFPENEALSTPATPETATRQEGGFLRYLADYYAATHGLGDRLLAFVLGLIAMAVLSLLKPTLGYRGIVLIVAGVAGLTVVAAFWFFLRRISGYFLGHERYVPDDAHSWSSVIAYGGMTALLPLCLLVAVEYSNPQQGVLATLIPRLKEEQRRWLEPAKDESKWGGIETGVAKVGTVGERGVAEGASSRPDPALSQLTPQQEPRVPDKAAQKSSGESVLATTENPTPEPEGNRPASTLPKDRSKGPNRPPTFAESASSDSPSSIRSADRVTPGEAVVAEGVGSTPDEALKDAFRNAVRQVVGAVVDAETMIKDDQVIDDKVLTYSDGFIKGYEEVPGSKKSQGGLHRLKIKAAVERRSVVAKLKAANVTVKEVDGKGLFAEVVTQLDAEGNAAQLLKKQLQGFPRTCVTASILGNFEIAEKTDDSGTIKYTVDVAPDLESYKVFAQSMKRTLEKLAKTKGEFTATFHIKTNAEDPWYDSFNQEYSDLCDNLCKWMPKAFQESSGHVPSLNKSFTTIALGTTRTKAGDRIEYSYFICDNAIRSEILAAALRAGTCKVTLLTGDKGVVATDRFALFTKTPWHRNFRTSLISSLGDRYRLHMLDLTQPDERRQPGLFLISPTFSVYTSSFSLGHRPSLQITRTLKLSLDELKSVRTTTCTVDFE